MANSAVRRQVVDWTDKALEAAVLPVDVAVHVALLLRGVRAVRTGERPIVDAFVLGGRSELSWGRDERWSIAWKDRY